MALRFPILSGLMILAALTSCTRPDSRVHVSYWDKWTGREGEAMRQVVAEYNHSQPHVVVEYLPVSAIDQKATVAVAGGDPPDILGMQDRNLAPFVDHHALISFDDFIRQDGQTPEQFLEQYVPVYAQKSVDQGHIYAVLTTPNATLLHWNKELFRQAGLDPEKPPRTLEELMQMSAKLDKRDPQTGAIVRLGFLPQEPSWFIASYPAWFGGALLDGNRIAIGTAPENLECYRWVRGYTDRYGLRAVQSFTSGFGNFESPQSAFLSGKVAMLFQGVYFNNFISMYAPGLDFGVAPWPKTPHGPDNFTTTDADILVIPRGAKHVAEAWDFLRYMSTTHPDAQTVKELGGLEHLCLLQVKISPFRIWSPYFEHHHPHPYISTFRKVAAGPHAYGLPHTPIWPEYEREVNTIFDKVRLEQDTPEHALAQAQAAMDNANRYYEEDHARREALPDAAR